MVKSLGLIGITAALLFSQGCGGKKTEVASAPASVPVAPSPPNMASIDPSAGQGDNQGSDGYEESSSSMPSGGDSGGPGMPRKRSMSSGSSDGMSSGSSDGMPGSGMNGEGSDENSNIGPNQGFPNNGMVGQAGNNQSGFGRGPSRPRRVVPPPTLKDQAVNAFQVGNPKRAFTLMEAYALVVSDEEAAEVLKHYRWASQRKRPQLGLNIAVGVSVKNPTGMTDYSPIGSQSQNNGGGFGGSGGGEFGMGGAPASSGNAKSLAETTGDFGKQLVAAFKEKHESGAWSPAFSEYSLLTERTGLNTGGGGAFGEGFSGGDGDFGFTEGSQPGFSDGMPPGMGQSGNNGGERGFQEEMNSGGMANSGSGRPNSGQMGSSGGNAMNSGAMGSSGGNSMNSGMGSSGGNAPNSGAMGSSGGNAPKSGGASIPNSVGVGSPLPFQGKGGMSRPGDGMGMSEPNMGPNMNGGPNMGGGQSMGGRGMGMPPAFAANMKLPAGSSPLAPCLTFIGVDEASKLMKKASQEGYDGLMLFEVTIGVNRQLQKVTNDTLVRVVQPSVVAKDVKRVYVSKSLNNLQSLRSKSKGEPDGLEDAVEKIVRETEEGLALQALPPALTPEVIATKRIPSLAKETESSVMDRLSEVNLYYFKGFIDEKQKADAFEQIAGSPGRVIATGSSSERLAAVEKILEREFK